MGYGEVICLYPSKSRHQQSPSPSVPRVVLALDGDWGLAIGALAEESTEGAGGGLETSKPLREALRVIAAAAALVAADDLGRRPVR